MRGVRLQRKGVDDVAELGAGHVKHAQDGLVPGRGGDQPGEQGGHRGHDCGVPSGRTLQGHRVPRAQVHRVVLRRAQDRRRPQPRQDRLAQRAVEQPGGQPDRDEVEHLPTVRGEIDEQVGVGGRGVLDEGVGGRAGSDMPAVRVEREGREQQGVPGDRLVRRRGGVQPLRHRRGAVARHGPGQRPARPGPLLDRPVDQQRGVVPAPATQHLPALPDVAQPHRCLPGPLDDDLVEGGQREQQGVVELGEAVLDDLDGRRVTQRQDDGGVVPRRRLTVRLERQPQDRNLAAPAGQLVRQVRGGRRGR